ncbi:MAG: hypothetical protein ACRDTU_15710 [Micromonosporaceae bacterium]
MRGLPFSPAAPNQSAPEYGDQVAMARRILAQHRRQRYPYGRSCGWCRQAYPCHQRRTAEHLLHVTATAATPAAVATPTAVAAKKSGVAAVPGLSHRQLSDPSTVTQAQLLMMRTGH